MKAEIVISFSLLRQLVVQLLHRPDLTIDYEELVEVLIQEE